MSRLNVFADEPWDMTAEKMRIRTRLLGMPLGANELGASLHELLPSSTGFHLHAHYGMEEMFFVLSGTPTLRTGSGEELLAPGDVVFCPRGIEGLQRVPRGKPDVLAVISDSMHAVGTRKGSILTDDFGG